MQTAEYGAQHTLDTKERRKAFLNKLAKNEEFVAEMLEAIADVEQGNYDVYTYDELRELVTVDRGARTVSDNETKSNRDIHTS